jgi:hypothetical protein
MHNSQAGGLVTSNLIDGQYSDSVNPNRALLNTNCIGCHQGVNSPSSLDSPYVLDITGPDYGVTGTEGNTLAGGNFYWVSQGFDATGHNVASVAPADNRLGNLPPGQTMPLSSQLSCAGSFGCHGDRAVNDQIESMFTAHHNNDMTTWKDGSTLPASYRFLNGIKGLEDQQYEFLPGSGLAGGHHNKYFGQDRSNENDTAEGTISSLCAQCHGDFHNGSGNITDGLMGAGVWLRHPTDYDMGNTDAGSEYRSYGDSGGGGTNEYSVVSPLATANTSDVLNSTVFTETDDTIVMCLSCHRAHGTPYDAILRWDYKSWPGGGFNGCAVCHTSKD